MNSRSSIYYDYYGERNEYGLFQMNRCILYCFGGILQQGGAATLPTADSGKVMTQMLKIIITLPLGVMIKIFNQNDQF